MLIKNKIILSIKVSHSSSVAILMRRVFESFPVYHDEMIKLVGEISAAEMKNFRISS